MTFDVENLKVTDSHRAVATFIKAESGKAPSANTVALVLSLAGEYRKSEAFLEQQAARQKAKDDKAAALRVRKQERLEKALAQARKLAADLGIDVPLPGDADAAPAAEEEPEEVEPDPEPEPEPAPKAKAPAKRKTAKGNTIAAVPDVADVDPGDAPEDTSAIVVVEAEDFFEEPSEPEGDDDDFFDDDDPAEY